MYEHYPPYEYMERQTEMKVLAEVDMWERRLRLCLRPKPSWMPGFVYNRLVKLLLIQTEERK
jgi:hypothetical protein